MLRLISFLCSVGVLLLYSTQSFSRDATQDFVDTLTRMSNAHPLKDAEERSEKAAKLQTNSAHYKHLPSIALFTERRSDRLLSDPTVNLTYDQVGVNANMNIYHFGLTSAQISEAEYNLKLQQIKVETTLLDIEELIGRKLFAMIRLEQELSKNMKVLAFAKRVLSVAKERYKRGLLPKDDLSNSEIFVEQLQMTISTQSNEKQKRLNDLKTLPQFPSEFTGAEWPFRDETLKGELAPGKLVLGTLSDHPKFLEQKYAMERIANSVKVAKASLLPSIDASVALVRQVPDIYQRGGNQLTGALTLTVPLFDRLDGYGQYQKLSVEQNAEELRRSNEERQLTLEAENSKVEFEEALSSIQKIEGINQRRQALYEAAVDRFEKGHMTLNDLSLEEDRFHSSELEVAQGWERLHIALLDLCHRYGRTLKTCLGSAQGAISARSIDSY